MRSTILLLLAGLVACAAPSTRVTTPRRAGPCATPEARQFDFWIGEWDVDNRRKPPLTPGAPRPAGAARDLVYPILGGCALVEHWEGLLAGGPVRGFSVRAYDPAAKRWTIVLHWPSARSRHFGMLTGEVTAGRGTFHTTMRAPGAKTVELRFTFSDISDNALRWSQALSVDGGATWDTSWIMDFKRRDRRRLRPVFTGPGAAPPPQSICPEPEARALDFLVGRWEGRDQAGRPVVVEGYLVNGGCTHMDFVTEGRAERFRVSGYEPVLGRWVQYDVDAAHLGFRRWEGGGGAQALTFTTGAAGAAAPAVRETWSGATPSQARYVREVAGAAGWRSVEDVRLQRVL